MPNEGKRFAGKSLYKSVAEYNAPQKKDQVLNFKR
jgi:hypothetical protein